ncbi:MAG: Holliday junction resolvase RuvX [Bacteroidales bacterium]
MGRIISIDYGRKRTGLAVTDTMQIVATGLKTIPTHTLMDFLKSYIKDNVVDMVIIGLPKQMNYTPSESMKYITSFVNRLRKEIPELKIEMYDERFTSKIAQKALIMGGAKRSQRQNKEIIDEMSAVIILNDYLESNKNIY